jgi:hypothetical protein
LIVDQYDFESGSQNYIIIELNKYRIKFTE